MAAQQHREGSLIAVVHKAVQQNTVRHLLGKARLSDMEVKVLLGLARQIRWYVANDPGSPPA